MVNTRASSGTEGGGTRASDAIADRLRRMIITLELAPGAVVTETYLQELLQCSRTPLREALQRLTQEHLVVSVPRRGVWIAELSLMDFGELVEMIDGVSRFVARLAAARVTDDVLERLADILERARQADSMGDLPMAAELDFDFHYLIAEASQNHYAVDVLAPLQRLVSRFSFVGFKRTGTAKGAIEDHDRVLEALRERDPDLAEARVAEHSEHGRQRIRAGL